MEINTSTFSPAIEDGDYEGIIKDFRTLTREEQIAFFYPLLTSGKGLKTLHDYFKKPGNANPFWVELFVSIDYVLLVTAARVNKAFLNSHFDSLQVLATHPEIYVRRHYTAFCQLRKYEQELFESASHADATIPDTNFDEWLWHMAFWMEYNKAYLWVKDPSGTEHPKWQQYMVWTGNHFLSDYIVKRNGRPLAPIHTNSEEVARKMCSYYQSRMNDDSPNPYFTVFDAWYKWYIFTATELDTYCFDLSFEVLTKDNELVIFAKDTNKFYEWKRNGEKQQTWLTELMDISLAESYKNVKQGEPFSVEQEIERRGIEARMVAEYYYLNEGDDFPIDEVLRTWHNITSSAFAGYVVPLDTAHQSNIPEKWTANVLEICKSGGTKPVLSLSTTELKNVLKQVAPAGTNENKIVSFLRQILIQRPQFLKPEYYNRFNPYVNFFSRPLLELGDEFYYLPAIIGETATGVSLVHNLLAQLTNAKQKHDNKELLAHVRNKHAPLAHVATSQIHKMEEVLAERFVKAGYEKVAYSKEYKVQGITKGEFDCLVYESGVLLIVEIKRTQFRNTLEEAWNEKMMVLDKAADQLDKGINFIRESFGWLQDVFPTMKESFEQLNIKTLIVSTSFEHDHELMNGRHLKVSLYEFDKIQESIDVEGARKMKKNPVDLFYDAFKNNVLWENLPKYNFRIEPIELPLK